ncbi:MAG: hypothetical protein JSW48_03510 [Betaproteobacteria bacterium]|nr:MAG: hypothetical protein JSW48_03510 [Betaproteobacteria bacterium]
MTRERVAVFACLLALQAIAMAAELVPTDRAEATATPSANGAANGDPQDAEEPDPASERAREEIAEEVKLRADEDPLAQQQEAKQLEKKQAEEAAEPVPELEEGLSGSAYGSARVRYRYTDSDNQIWGDGGSRVGLRGRWVYGPENSLFGWVEYGFNLLDSVDRLFNPGGTGSERARSGSFFPRLIYLGWETPNNILTVGKNWSTYYQVAGWTDLMQGAGGSALGVYNANTDGGPTGTGRADGTLQTRLSIDFLPEAWFEPFKLNVQIQNGRPIPQTESLDYGWAVGASTILELENNYFAGLAINYAEVRDVGSPQAQAVSLRGDAQAYLLGLRKFSDDWYVAFGGARLVNHETTDQGTYFDGWGWEFYAHRRVAEKVWFGGGFNSLQPDADQVQAQDYRVAYGLAELRYTFRTFSRMLFLNYRFERGSLQSGEKIPNTLTVGIRWDFP